MVDAPAQRRPRHGIIHRRVQPGLRRQHDVHVHRRRGFSAAGGVGTREFNGGNSIVVVDGIGVDRLGPQCGIARIRQADDDRLTAFIERIVIYGGGKGGGCQPGVYGGRARSKCKIIRRNPGCRGSTAYGVIHRHIQPGYRQYAHLKSGRTSGLISNGASQRERYIGRGIVVVNGIGVAGLRARRGIVRRRQRHDHRLVGLVQDIVHNGNVDSGAGSSFRDCGHTRR
ncbi:hypothetical protein ES703_74363 [subsurface metagenome]